MPLADVVTSAVKMRVVEFRVQKYKTIADTGWVKVRGDVTSLLGKNESGKSAVLQAIWKFNNVAGGRYDALYDYPKERYTKDRGTDPVVVSLCFELEDADVRAFDTAFKFPRPKRIEASTTYSGKRSYEFEIPITPVPVPPRLLEVQKAVHDLASGADAASAEPAKAVTADLTEILGSGGEATKIRDAARRIKLALPPLAAALGEQHADLTALVDSLLSVTTPDEERAAFEKWIEARLPVFIYFEDYGRLDTKIHLPTFLKERGAQPVVPRVRTQVALFEWTGLAPDEIHRLGIPQQANEALDVVQRRKDERSTLLESASYQLTGDWMSWWDQREHRLHISADGDDLVLRVSDSENPWQIPFHERSKGFQWFFSFYLTFLVESEKAHSGAILLLDEPGLHLHIRAQQKLLGFFQRVAQKNQIIYSSHSPFMVDPDHLDNIRTVYLKKPEGSERKYTHVSTGDQPEGDRDTVLPLQAALGYEIAQTLFLGKKVLIVEGITDYWIIQALKEALREQRKSLLPDDVVVLFAGGTSHMLPLVSLFVRPDSDEHRLVVLLDADKAGLEKASQLRRDLLPGANNIALISDADLLALRQGQVEDVLHRDDLLDAVKRVKGASFKMPATPNALNVPFMQQLYTENGWGDFSHERKAEVVIALMDAWRTKSAPPSAVTLANGEKLLGGLATRFK